MSQFQLSQLTKSIKENLQIIKEVPAQEQENPLDAALKAAKEEWDNAKNFFNHATDVDLVDCAIYQMEAAERRYMHLLKLVKREGFAK